MSLRVASVLAWILAILSFLASLGPLARFPQLTLAGRTTAVWLFVAGIGLAVVGYGLQRRRLYAARLSIIVCGLWLTVQMTAIVRALVRHVAWSPTVWSIVLLETIASAVILLIVVKHRSTFANTQHASTLPGTHAA